MKYEPLPSNFMMPNGFCTIVLVLKASSPAQVKKSRTNRGLHIQSPQKVQVLIILTTVNCCQYQSLIISALQKKKRPKEYVDKSQHIKIFSATVCQIISHRKVILVKISQNHRQTFTCTALDSIPGNEKIIIIRFHEQV